MTWNLKQTLKIVGAYHLLLYTQLCQFTSDFHETSLNDKIEAYITYVQIQVLYFKLLNLQIDFEETDLESFWCLVTTPTSCQFTSNFHETFFK